MSRWGFPSTPRELPALSRALSWEPASWLVDGLDRGPRAAPRAQAHGAGGETPRHRRSSPRGQQRPSPLCTPSTFLLLWLHPFSGPQLPTAPWGRLQPARPHPPSPGPTLAASCRLSSGLLLNFLKPNPSSVPQAPRLLLQLWATGQLRVYLPPRRHRPVVANFPRPRTPLRPTSTGTPWEFSERSLEGLRGRPSPLSVAVPSPPSRPPH